MGIMVYSLLWVMQDFVHQPHDLLSWYTIVNARFSKSPSMRKYWGKTAPKSWAPVFVRVASMEYSTGALLKKLTLCQLGRKVGAELEPSLQRKTEPEPLNLKPYSPRSLSKGSLQSCVSRPIRSHKGFMEFPNLSGRCRSQRDRLFDRGIS